MAQDVFISYSHKDESIADTVCSSLENAGVRCWIAPRDIAPGLDWPTAITRSIRLCRVMVLIFSASSNASKDVSRELILASNNDLVIIPFRIEDVPLEPGKEYYLARTHWLEAGKPPTQKQINALVGAVKTFLPDQGMAAPAQPAPQAVAAQQVAVTPPRETAPTVAEPAQPEAVGQIFPQEIAVPTPETASAVVEPAQPEAEPLPPSQGTEVSPPETLEAVAEPAQMEVGTPAAQAEAVTPPPALVPVPVEPADLEAAPRTIPEEMFVALPEPVTVMEETEKPQPVRWKPNIPWKSKWVWGALLLLVLVGGGVLAARSLASLAMAAPPTRTRTRIPNTTETPYPTWTGKPAATDTPWAGSWTQIFAKPILAAIAARPADFQDDFSQLSPQWSVYSGELRINNGMLAITVDPKLGSPNNKVNNPGMHFNNFVLQFEANLQELSPCGGKSEHDQFDIYVRGGGNSSMGLSLYRCPLVVAVLRYCQGSGCINLQERKFNLDTTQLITITIISRGTEYGIYMNDLPFLYVKDVERELGQDITLSLGAVDTQTTATLEIDNLKMWDLDAIPNLSKPAPSLSATPTPNPIQTSSFAEPIMAAIADRPPAFQDDFSSLSPDWSIDSGGIKSVKGVLAISVDPQAGQYKGIVSNPAVSSIKNFVMEFDADLHNLSQCGKNNEHDEFVIYWHYTDSTVSRFALFQCPWLVGDLSLCDNVGCTQLLEVKPSFDTRTFLTITLISKGAEYAILMNGSPITYLNDKGRPPGKQINLTLKAMAGAMVTVAIDNLKVWDLDAIPNLP